MWGRSRVRMCARGAALCHGERLTVEDLRAFHQDFASPASELLSLERALEARSLTGGTARARVADAVDVAEAEIQQGLERLDAQEKS